MDSRTLLASTQEQERMCEKQPQMRECCALRFPQGKVPCGIPQGYGFFPLWDFSKIEYLSLKFREMLVGWFGRRL
jgi:hypothetical protein